MANILRVTRITRIGPTHADGGPKNGRRIFTNLVFTKLGYTSVMFACVTPCWL